MTENPMAGTLAWEWWNLHRQILEAWLAIIVALPGWFPFRDWLGINMVRKLAIHLAAEPRIDG